MESTAAVSHNVRDVGSFMDQRMEVSRRMNENLMKKNG
jgi:hypothetical protein